jgi:hypothetical protein
MDLNILPRESLQIQTEETMSTKFYQVEGYEISWIEVEEKTSTTFSNNKNNHLWSNFGIYSQSDANKFNITRDEGGLSDTAIGGIGPAYDNTGVLVGSIDSSTFRASLGPNMRLTIPISGGTGSLSGLTSLNLYTAFFEQNNSKSPDGSGPCATWLVDCLWSESHPQSTYQAGIGYGYDPANNPNENTNGQYRSGLMYLFSEDVYFSGNTGTTWSTGWSGNSRYTFGNSPLAQFDGDERNLAVGFVNLDAGLIHLFDTNIVSAFNTSVATGGTITSGLTFSTTDCNLIVKDRDLSTVLKINTTLNPDTFTKTMNSSVLDAKQAGITDCDSQVAITKVCYYDEFGNLVATGLLDEPLFKRPQDYTLLQASVTLDGGTLDSPENSRTTFP